MPCSELANPGVLDAVRILILIHVQVLPLGAIPLGDRWCLLQQAESFNEEIIKVERIEALQLFRVATRKASNQPLMVRHRLILHLVRSEAVVLGATDRAEDQARLR